MSELSITVCSFYITKRNAKKNKHIYYLNDSMKYTIDDSVYETNIQEILQVFSHRFDSPVRDENKKKTFCCKYIDKSDFEKYISYVFQVNSGYYGSSSTIVNSETRELRLNMLPDDVAEKKYYVYVIIPKDNKKVTVNKGMMIFQNIGIFGIKTITCDYLRKFLADEYGMTLKCATVSPALFVKKILHRENLKKMILVKNYKSMDPTDSYYTGYGSECRTLSKLCFDDKKWDKMLASINKLLYGEVTMFEFDGQLYDVLKLEVLIGERKRTISVQNIENLSIIEPLPNGIKDNDGYANLKKLIDYCADVTNDYLQEMVLQIE